MTRFIVMTFALVAISFGLMMQLPIVIVGGSAAALVGLAPWGQDKCPQHGDRKV